MDTGNAFPKQPRLRSILEDLFGPASVSSLGAHWVSVSTDKRKCGIYRGQEDTEQRFTALIESRDWLGGQVDALVLLGDQEIIVVNTEQETKLQLVDITSKQNPEKILSGTIRSLLSTGDVKRSEDIRKFRDWQLIISNFIFEEASDRNQGRTGTLSQQTVARMLSPGLQRSLVRWTLSNDVDSVVDIADGNGGILKSINEFVDDRRDGNISRYVCQHDPSLIGLDGVLLNHYFADEWAEWNSVGFDEFLAPSAENTRTECTLDEFTESTAGPDENQSLTGFDAAIGVPWPIGRASLPTEYRDHLRSVSEIGRPTMPALLSLEMIRQMNSGGKAAFILPSSIWRSGDYPAAVQSYGRIHSIIQSVELYLRDTSIDPRFQFDILLFEKTQKEEEGPIRVLNLHEEGLPEVFDQLLHAPAESIAQKEWEGDLINVDFIQQDDLIEFPPKVVLSNPALTEVFRSAEFEPLEELVEFQRPQPTGNNEFFYFEESDMRTSDISDRFFTPLIKRLPTAETKYDITIEDIDYYALDIREYLDSLSNTPGQLTEEEVLNALDSDGHKALVEYIQSHEKPRQTYHNGPFWFCPFPLADHPTPDLVISHIGDARWCTIHVEEQVIIDQMSYCVYFSEQQNMEILHTLLNSNLYQQLVQYFGEPIQAGYARFTIRDLRRIPILSTVLTPDNAEKLQSHFPPKTRREEHELDQTIIDICNSSEARAGLEQLFETDDEFAWAWFLNVDQYQEFRDIYANNPVKAEEFISDKITSEDIDEILSTFTGSELTKQRASILTEVVDEYNNGKYRLFLYGIAPQFEGVLIDWAEERGYETEMRNGLPHIRIPDTESDSGKEYIPKRLNDLISTFLPGRFGGFLDDEIRDTRNKLTHGELVEANRQKATVFLLCLHTLCQQIIRDEIEGQHR